MHKNKDLAWLSIIVLLLYLHFHTVHIWSAWGANVESSNSLSDVLERTIYKNVFFLSTMFPFPKIDTFCNVMDSNMWARGCVVHGSRNQELGFVHTCHPSKGWSVSKAWGEENKGPWVRWWAMQSREVGLERQKIKERKKNTKLKSNTRGEKEN